MNRHNHDAKPTLSTPPTLSDSFDPAQDIENTTKHGVCKVLRVERVDRVALRKGSLLAAIFGVDSASTPDSLPTLLERPSDELPVEPWPVASAIVCQFCESMRLGDCDNPPGIRCDDCGSLVWIDDGETIRKVGWNDHDLGSMAPDDLPTCCDCGRLCDTQTLDDAWHCSRCDASAASRRKETE